MAKEASFLLLLQTIYKPEILPCETLRANVPYCCLSESASRGFDLSERQRIPEILHQVRSIVQGGM